MMKAKIVKDQNGTHRITVQRAKYKHWFVLGTHPPTDNAFYKALRSGEIEWDTDIRIYPSLFGRRYRKITPDDN